MKIQSDIIQITKVKEAYFVTVHFNGTTGSLGYHQSLQEAVERPLCEARMSERAQQALRTIEEQGEKCGWNEDILSEIFPPTEK